MNDRTELRLRILLALLGSILLTGPARAQTPNQYSASASAFFPSGAFGVIKQGGDARAKWYARDLTALGEPSLFLEAKSGAAVHVYRFLWLRTFDHPISVRLTIYSEGEGSIVTKMTDGAGGYNAGKLIVDKTVLIHREQVQNVLAELQEIDFWSLKTEDYGKSYQDASGRHFGVLGADGAQWILEGVHDGQYHVVDRWSPEGTEDKIAGSKNYAKLCRYLLELGRVEVEEKDIY